jgi:hypothetical protein
MMPVEFFNLQPGDAIRLTSGEIRIVVRVIDGDGAVGGLVDTRPFVGEYSPDNGFRTGHEIESVIRAGS